MATKEGTWSPNEATKGPITMSLEDWQNRQRAQKQEILQKRRESAELLRNYRGGMREEDLKLAVLRDEERRNRKDAERMWNLLGKEADMNELKQHAISPSKQDERNIIAKGAVSSVAASFKHSPTEKGAQSEVLSTCAVRRQQHRAFFAEREVEVLGPDKLTVSYPAKYDERGKIDAGADSAEVIPSKHSRENNEQCALFENERRQHQGSFKSVLKARGASNGAASSEDHRDSLRIGYSCSDHTLPQQKSQIPLTDMASGSQTEARQIPFAETASGIQTKARTISSGSGKLVHDKSREILGDREQMESNNSGEEAESGQLGFLKQTHPKHIETIDNVTQGKASNEDVQIGSADSPGPKSTNGISDRSSAAPVCPVPISQPITDTLNVKASPPTTRRLPLGSSTREDESETRSEDAAHNQSVARERMDHSLVSLVDANHYRPVAPRRPPRTEPNAIRKEHRVPSELLSLMPSEFHSFCTFQMGIRVPMVSHLESGSLSAPSFLR